MHKDIHTKRLPPTSCFSTCKRFNSWVLFLPTGERLWLVRRQFRCLICGKEFANCSKLNRHILIHSGEKPFPCPHCHKRFNQEANRDQHVALHTKTQRYQCNICKKMYLHASYLKRHRFSAHDIPD